MKKSSILIFTFLLTLKASAGAEIFKKGTRELGIANLGIGYSNIGGLSLSLSSRFQYYLFDRFGLGGFAFYNNFNDREWMGLGPSATYVFFAYSNYFARLDQQLTAAKFNGFTDDPASVYGTSGISINYIQDGSRFYIGLGYARTYALSDGRVIWPNTFQVTAGWIF